MYDLSVKISCCTTNGKYCTDETVIKEFSEDFTCFPQNIITTPNSYHGLTATMKVMIFLCGRYSSFHVKNVQHIFVVQQCIEYFLPLDCRL